MEELEWWLSEVAKHSQAATERDVVNTFVVRLLVCSFLPGQAKGW